eukprot:scaffold11596_cov128-Isochrysis_galbana.AAC.2
MTETETRLVPTECFDELSARNISSSVHIFVEGQLLTLPHSFSLLPQPAFVVQRRPRLRRGPGPGLTEWKNGSGHILQGAHLVTVPQSYIRTTA